MWDLVSNSQLYGFNNSSIGKMCVAKCEAENGQINIIRGINGWSAPACYENLCSVQYNKASSRK
jgi:hypothetical protein